MITAGLIAEADLVLVMEPGRMEALQNEFPENRRKIYLFSDAAKGIPYDIPDPVLQSSGEDVVGEIHMLIRNS